jgi:mono/diheme cytochrome c family protein
VERTAWSDVPVQVQRSVVPSWVVLATLAWCAAALSSALPTSAQAVVTDLENATAAELYQTACAACHGADGRGQPATQLGFDLPVPDFTDCSFASREPDGDWGAVIHSGGPVRGFDEKMPAFGQALSWEQILRILGHVRTFCPDPRWPPGEFNLPRPLVTEKAFPEDETVLTVIGAAEGDTEVTHRLTYERRFGPRNQMEVVVPYGLRDRGGDDGWTGGLGDVAVGVKRVLFHDIDRGSIFSFTGEVVLPTGDEDDGFGKGTAVVEPFVTWGQLLPRDAFLQMQAGFELPTDGDRADDEAFLRATIGRTWTRNRFGRAISPMIEILGGRELVSGEKWLWDVLPQVQVTLNTRQHVMANVGVRLPVTDSGERDTQILFYILWDWFDGGFFEGW